jgi:hypothetical protein
MVADPLIRIIGSPRRREIGNAKRMKLLGMRVNGISTVSQRLISHAPHRPIVRSYPLSLPGSRSGPPRAIANLWPPPSTHSKCRLSAILQQQSDTWTDAFARIWADRPVRRDVLAASGIHPAMIGRARPSVHQSLLPRL